MSSDWINHVKKFSRDNNMTYGCAISDPRCKESYQIAKNKKILASRAKKYLVNARLELQKLKDEKKKEKKQLPKLTEAGKLLLKIQKKKKRQKKQYDKYASLGPIVEEEEKKSIPIPSASKFYPMATREQLRANRRPKTKMVSGAKRYRTKKEIAEEDKIYEEEIKKRFSPEGILKVKLDNLFENFKLKHGYASSQYKKEDAKAKYIPEIAKLIELPAPTNEEEELKFLNKFLKSLYYGSKTNEITDKKEFLKKRDIFMGYGRKRKTTKCRSIKCK
jgi:hypothetical protein